MFLLEPFNCNALLQLCACLDEVKLPREHVCAQGFAHHDNKILRQTVTNAKISLFETSSTVKLTIKG